MATSNHTRISTILTDVIGVVVSERLGKIPKRALDRGDALYKKNAGISF